MRTPVESPNTLQSTAVARMVEALCEGPIHGLVDGHKSVFFDKTPWRNKDGSYNYTGISFDMRNGQHNQDPIPGFSQVEAEFNVNALVKYGNPITRNIDDQEIDAVRVTLSTPGLVFTSTAESTAGDRMPTTVAYAIGISSAGGPFQWVVNTTLSGKTNTTFEWSHRIALPKGGSPWQVRVERREKDSTSDTLQNSFSFARYTRIIENKLRYPDTALVGLTVDAQKFGNNIPARAYEIYGQIVQVPSNYDPWTRRYSGIWNGTFKTSWTDNPAWIFYYALSDPRSGLGRELRETSIDKWGLYSIARYCDELVPNGRGGQEPRFAFNGVINTQQDAKTVLSNIAGSFRGLCYFAMGQIFCAHDRPLDPIRNITNDNVIDGKFVYEGTSHSSRHSVALVNYLDPEDGYDTAIEVVEDPEAIQEFGYRTLDVVAYGCTSRGQAWRQGKMALYADKNLTRGVSFAMGLEGADLMPGQVVNIMDSAYAGLRQAGRLAGATLLSVVLDHPYNFEPSLNYDIEITLPDNTLFKVGIKNPGKSAYQVNLAKPLPVQPVSGAIWVLYSSKLVPQLFRIVNVVEREGLVFEYSAIAYDPRKFDEVEKGIVLPERPTSLLPSGPLERPYNLAIEEYIYLKGGLSPAAGMTFSWFTSDPRVMSYEVEWKSPSAHDFLARTAVGGMGFEMDIQEQGVYVFRVRSVDAMGRVSGWATIEAAFLGLYRPPAQVKGFRSRVFDDDLILTWQHDPDLLIDHYEIRFSPSIDGSATWERSAIIHDFVGRGINERRTSLQVGTYFIKAVSIKGVYSAKAAVITNDISADFIRMNVVWETEQSPDWLGIKDRTLALHSGDFITGANNCLTLKNMPIDSEGHYYFEPYIVDLGGVFLSRLDGGLIAFGVASSGLDVYAFDDIYAPENAYFAIHSSIVDVYGIKNIYALEDVYGAPNADSWSAVIEYSFMQADPTLAGANDIYSYKDAYAPINVYDPESPLWSPWRPLAQPEDILARAFRFRIKLNSFDGLARPLVASAWAIIDMPDRWLILEDLELAADSAGHWIAFEPPFYRLVAVAAPMIQEGEEGDWYRIADKSREGYRLFLFDKNGAPAARVVDLMAKGYGALQ